VIASFGDRGTEDLYHGKKSKAARRFPMEIVSVALRKLDMINAAQGLQDLASPPGNHLEALRGNLKGYHSIRINDQWRVVFGWADGKAHEVRITDYHG
jgi:proteic killer suppression protein